MAEEKQAQNRPIVTLDRARAFGLPRYFTGIPCKRGHLEDRKVIDRSCVACNRIKDATWKSVHAETIAKKRRSQRSLDYYRSYRTRNPDTVRAASKRWRDANQELARARSAAWQTAYPDRQRLAERNYRAKSGAKIRAAQATYRAANPEKGKATSAKWREANKDRIAAKATRRRAAKLRATPTWADESAMFLLYVEARRMTLETGVIHHVDHVVPLKSAIVCGLHCPANLQVIPGRENLSKCNRWWPDMP